MSCEARAGGSKKRKTNNLYDVNSYSAEARSGFRQKVRLEVKMNIAHKRLLSFLISAIARPCLVQVIWY